MRRFLVLALVLAGCAPTPQADYRAGRYRAAREGFRAAIASGDTSAAAAYNLGTARLRLREHAAARGGLEAAAARAGAGGLRFAAEFNAGLADLEPALAVAPGDSLPREALQRAVRRYRAALRLRPGDLDAKWNLELAERALRRRPPETSGGGGERPRPDAGGGGQGGGERTSAGPGNPGLTREEADRILSAADQEERAVQRRRVQSAPASSRAARDW